MTKKSQGRLLRDKIKNDFANEFSQNRNWDEVYERHQECQQLLAMHLGVANILDNPEIQSVIQPSEHRTLVDNIQLLTKDLRERINELNLIYAIHSDKRGAATEDNIMLSFEVMEKYTAWLSLMQTNVQPTWNHILEITSVLEKRVLERQALTDPNVTSDVEFKDTPSGQQAQKLEAGLAAADHTNPQSE